MSFRMWLVSLLLRPKDVVAGRHYTHVGPVTIGTRIAIPDPSTMYHDARRAIHCGDVTVYFYGETEEWVMPPYVQGPT